MEIDFKTTLNFLKGAGQLVLLHVTPFTETRL